jgi:IclR family acetate operon transcriptional repressor
MEPSATIWNVTELTPSDPGEVESAGDRLVGSDRVLAVLVELARHPSGVGLDDLARVMRSPKPTIHRNLVSLRRAGLAQQDGRGHYILGDEFLRMAFAHHDARPDHVRVEGVLQALARQFGETAHYAGLSGADVVYRSKVDPPTGAARLTSTVGGRNPAHSTAVGKLLLAHALPDQAALEGWIGARQLPRFTERTLITVAELNTEFDRIRRLGYAVDDQENEDGVNCLAVPAFLNSPTVPSGAISVSALAYRTPLPTLIDQVSTIQQIVGAGQGEFAS